MVLQSVIVVDSPLAFFCLLLADGFGGALTSDKAGPTIVGAMEFGGIGFARAVGLAALAVGGGDRAGEKGALGADDEGGSGDMFWVFCA